MSGSIIFLIVLIKTNASIIGEKRAVIIAEMAGPGH